MQISRRDFNRGLAAAATVIGSQRTSNARTLWNTKNPSTLELQQRFVNLRFGMFLHFNMATFQDREWGDPSSSPKLFHPTALDTDQWASVAKQAGMTWGCLTTRHHDGFCIWPTKTSASSVAQGVQIDVVRSYVDSFRKAGLRVGLYYSILSLRDDIRHFNVTPQKIALIKDQLTELFTNYGEIDILITDGWDAPWSRITYDEVPFREIYDHIKAMQPQCLICDLNAASYPSDGLYYSDVKAFEQNAGQRVPEGSNLPALSCVTITEGWFWKQRDVQGPLKPAETVVHDWLMSLNQRHCNLILNAPPTREGKLAPNVVERLIEIGKLWTPGTAAPVQEHVMISTPNLTKGKPIHASSSPDTIGPDMANDGNFRTAWSPDERDKQPWLEVDLLQDRRVSVVTLVQSQRTESAGAAARPFVCECWNGNAWNTVAQATGANATAIIRVKPITGRRFRIRFFEGAAPPHVAEFGLYDEP